MVRDRQPREQKPTLLVYGEGQNEADFATHLKSCFTGRQGPIGISIKPGQGGSPGNLLTKAIRVPGEFTRRVILLDADKLAQTQRLSARRHGVELIVADPALECLLLAVLGDQSSFTTEQCVDALNRAVGALNWKTDWNRHFPKDVLIKALDRISDPRLDPLRRLVKLMRGDSWND